MTKDKNKYGLLWLLLVECLAFLICFIIAMDIEDDGFLVSGTLNESFKRAIPVMIVGIPFYCVGFAARGHEKKSISLSLDEKDDQEKSILIGVIAKSMDKRPKLLSWRSIDMKGDKE